MSREVTVTAVIINYKTGDLTRRAITTFREFYPATPLLLVDNGSHDESTAMMREFADRSPQTTRIILNNHNLHHGPAMDQSLHAVETSYVLFIDSDCEIIRGGFIESMMTLAEENPDGYSAGKRVWMNERGFDTEKSKNAFEYIRPICVLIKRELYLTLPPFERHGTPCLANMIEASRRGYALLDFPVEQYVLHKGRGTAGQYGYGLGWRGKMNYLLNKLGL